MITFETISKLGSREINEDFYEFGQRDNVSVFVVADGLGGHGKGEVASAIAAQTIKRVVEESGNVQLDTVVDSAIMQAQETLLKEQARQHANDEMKTTVVVLCMDEHNLCWGHVGDSRLYAFHKNKIIARTLDHSIPQMLVLSGEIPERKIRNHPQRNMLLRVLGIEWDRPRHEISEVMPISEYQAFLLCSDGFWEFIKERNMCKLLKKSKTVEEWLAKMTEIVEKTGQKKDMDNYTAIAVWVN